MMYIVLFLPMWINIWPTRLFVVVVPLMVVHYVVGQCSCDVSVSRVGLVIVVIVFVESIWVSNESS